MPSSYTSNLKLALPATGELSGTWGDVVNQNITSMIEEAITSKATVSSWTSNAASITTANGVSSAGRALFLDMTGTLTATGTLTVPTANKFYIVRNATTGGFAVTVKMAAGTTVSVANGTTTMVYTDGTNTLGVLGSYATLAGSETLTNKTFNLASNTLTGTTAQFNTALSDGDFATLAGSETLTNKTLTDPDITINTAKTTPVDADEVVIRDSAASYSIKKLTWANLKVTLKTWIEATGFSLSSSTKMGRADTASEGGQLNFARASDDANHYAIDVMGSGTTPSLRVLNVSAARTDLTLDNDGELGVGQTTPAAKLDVLADSTNPAVRITQTGSGNALLVEDSGSPDSSPFVVDTNGIVITGNTAAVSAYGFNNQFQVLGTTNAYQLNAAFRNDAFSPFLTLAHSRNTSIGGHTVLQNGDDTGLLAFAGSDGTQFIRTAHISSAVDGTPGTNDMPGRLVFSTTADGASSPTERMRIDAAGDAQLASVNAGGSRLFAVRNVSTTTGTAARFDLATGSANAYAIHAVTEAATPFYELSNGAGITGGMYFTSGSTSAPIVFRQLSTERMRIDTNGRLLKGVASGSAVETYAPQAQAVLYASTNGTPATSGTTDTSIAYRFGMASLSLDVGVYAGGTAWIQNRLFNNFATNYDIALQPNGGNVGIGGAASAGARLHVFDTNALVMSQGTGGYGSFYARGSGTNPAYVFFGNVTNGEGARLSSDPANANFVISTGASATQVALIDANQFSVIAPTAKLGYGTGAGGTVTQATSKSTGVTLNKPTGQITMNNAALAAGARVSFQFNNSLITVNDTVLLSLRIIGGNYLVSVIDLAAGAAFIELQNKSAVSLSESVTINFAIIKGATT